MKQTDIKQILIDNAEEPSDLKEDGSGTFSTFRPEYLINDISSYTKKKQLEVVEKIDHRITILNRDKSLYKNRSKEEDYSLRINTLLELRESIEQEIEGESTTTTNPISNKLVDKELLEYLNSLKKMSKRFEDDFGTFDYDGFGSAVMAQIDYFLNKETKPMQSKDNLGKPNKSKKDVRI